ncbi:MAG TPA: hypothetical protein VM639_24570 [Dongiaceae bacterium]|nr:hypothetical protein [Dongiaceae bacterium]
MTDEERLADIRKMVTQDFKVTELAGESLAAFMLRMIDERDAFIEAMTEERDAFKVGPVHYSAKSEASFQRCLREGLEMAAIGIQGAYPVLADQIRALDPASLAKKKYTAEDRHPMTDAPCVLPKTFTEAHRVIAEIERMKASNYDDREVTDALLVAHDDLIIRALRHYAQTAPKEDRCAPPKQMATGAVP